MYSYCEILISNVYHTASSCSKRPHQNFPSKFWQGHSRGRPTDRRHLSASIREYWPFREELTLDESHIYKGRTTIVSLTSRPYVLKNLRRPPGGSENAVSPSRAYIRDIARTTLGLRSKLPVRPLDVIYQTSYLWYQLNNNLSNNTHNVTTRTFLSQISLYTIYQ